MNTIVPMVSDIVDFHHCQEDYRTAVDSRHTSRPELHVHPFYQLDLFPEGHTTVFIEGCCPPLCSEPWSGLLIPPMTGHAYGSERTALQVTFKFHVHPRYWLHFAKPKRLIPFPTVCKELIREVRDLSQTDPSLYEHHLTAVITMCLVHWLRNTESTSVREVEDPWSHRIRLSIERIAEIPDVSWNVADLARQCHVSPDHFRRQFMRIVGVSPQRFALEFRMRTAAAHLLNEDLAIKEAAAKVGYSTVHAFSRAFKNVFGTSPAAYLANLPRHL